MPQQPSTDADAIEIARRKQEQGRGIKNSEIALLRHAEKVNAQIVSSPARPTPAKISDADIRVPMRTVKDSLAADEGGGPDLTARVAALETLLSGLTRQTVTYCSGGSSSSKTVLMS